MEVEDVLSLSSVSDPRISPAEQSIQFYEAVKSIGRAETELVVYPGQPHGVRDPRLTRDLLIRKVVRALHPGRGDLGLGKWLSLGLRNIVLPWKRSAFPIE